MIWYLVDLNLDSVGSHRVRIEYWKRNIDLMRRKDTKSMREATFKYIHQLAVL